MADEEAGRDALFLRSIVENIPDMIFVKDARELRFVLFNRAGEELLGVPRAAMYGKSDHDFFPPSEADFFTAKDREVLRVGTVLDIPEEPIHTAHGERWLHTRKVPVLSSDGEPLYLLGISVDITQRKQAETALEAARRELQDRDRALAAVLRHFPGAVWTVRDGVIVAADGAATEAIGLAVSRALCEALPPERVGADVDAVQDEARRAGSASCELRIGDRFYGCRVSRAVEPGAFAWVALDTTEHRRLEAARLEVKMRDGQKLESLGVLAGGIAHDFNNLLVGVLGNATLAQSALPLDHPARRALDRIERAAQRAADLTRQMLAYSGRGRFAVEAVDVRAVIAEMAGLLQMSTSARAVVEFDFAPELGLVEADVAQLRQVVMNLITNAADAIADGGTPGRIVVRAAAVDADAEYLSRDWSANALSPGRYALVEVSDNGVGMTEEVRMRMFDPFFTTKPTGHGLGLAATLGIVRSHGGAIRVYTQIGRGTSVKVLFPTIDAPRTDDRPEPPRPPIDTGGLRVLVVDDDDAVRAFAREALAGAGHQVVDAASGGQAVAIFQAAATPFDVVLLDMTMPGLSGEETYRQLRLCQPGVRVVLSSGYNESEAMARFAGRDLAGFLQKPYTYVALLAAIRDRPR